MKTLIFMFTYTCDKYANTAIATMKITTRITHSSLFDVPENNFKRNKIIKNLIFKFAKVNMKNHKQNKL